MTTETLIPQGFSPSADKADESDKVADYADLKVMVALTAGTIAGRVALQHVPNVSPVIAVTAASGYYFGIREGVVTGASAYYLSNFLVYGGQGPWTFFQVAGAASAGLAAGIMGKKLSSKLAYLTSVLVGVLLFQISVNIGSLTYAAFTGMGLAYLASAVPFALTHISSSLGFGLMLYGSKEKIGLYRKN